VQNLYFRAQRARSLRERGDTGRVQTLNDDGTDPVTLLNSFFRDRLISKGLEVDKQ
jgi:hypothetical protein